MGLRPCALPICKKPQARAKEGTPAQEHKPFSRREFVQCLRTGAERFGWSQRNPQPAQRREGRWLIGLGMAGAYRGAPVMKSAARVRLEIGRASCRERV